MSLDGYVSQCEKHALKRADEAELNAGQLSKEIDYWKEKVDYLVKDREAFTLAERNHKNALFERIEELEKENEALKEEIALKDEILRKYKKENEKLRRVALRKGWE